MSNDVGTLLRSARQSAGLTQAELSAVAGTSQSAIAAYEGGTKVPTVGTLDRLLGALGQKLKLSSEPARSAPTLNELRTQLDTVHRIARTHRARDVRVFGSVARGEAGPSSDIDLLVDFEPGVTLLDVIGMESDLSEALGHPVHITTTGAARGRLASIKQESIPL